MERPQSPRGNLPRREPAAALPPDARTLAETLAERLDLATEKCRIELELSDGRLVAVWLHRKLMGRAIDAL